MTVEPSVFSFKSLLEKQSFTVKIEGTTAEVLLSASLVLSDAAHYVRSSVYFYLLDELLVVTAPSEK